MSYWFLWVIIIPMTPMKPSINLQYDTGLMIDKVILICLSALMLFSQHARAVDILELDIKSQNKVETVRIELLDDPSFAPNHVARIKQLVADGAYDKLAIHRAIAGFMIQTGDVQFGKIDDFDTAHVGTGASKYPNLDLEPSEQPFIAGVVGMARGHNKHSANSQFFIMTGDHPHLNGAYSVVGIVLEGLEFVKGIKTGSPASNGKVINPDYIVQARIVESKT